MQQKTYAWTSKGREKYKANLILLERVEALENKVRKIDEEEINGIKEGLSIRPTIDYLEERIDITERRINNQVDGLTQRLNALEDKQHKISETVRR